MHFESIRFLSALIFYKNKTNLKLNFLEVKMAIHCYPPLPLLVANMSNAPLWLKCAADTPVRAGSTSSTSTLKFWLMQGINQLTMLDLKGTVHSTILDLKGTVHSIMLDLKGTVHSIMLDLKGTVHSIILDLKGTVHSTILDLKGTVHSIMLDLKGTVHVISTKPTLTE